MSKPEPESENEKEIYRLWYECLKESSEYRSYRDANVDRPIKTVEDVYREGMDISISLSRGRKRLLTPIERMYDVFGDVFSYAFEDWWHERMVRLLRLDSTEVDCIQIVEQDMMRCAQKLYALVTEDAQNITVEKITGLLNRYLGKREGVVPLQVFAYYPSSPTLLRRFEEIINIHKAANNITEQQEINFVSLIIPRPTESARYREYIEKHLQRYRLHKGHNMTWKQIILQENLTQYIEDDGTIKPNGITALKNNNRSMQNIIKYAAKGIFPKYQ